MKYIFIIIAICMFSTAAYTQMSIGQGIALTGPGAAYIVLDNLDLQHDAATSLFNFTFKFTGNTDANIKGSKVVAFSSIELNKSNNAKVILADQITATGNILFNGGLLDLHGKIINLGSTGSLFNETAASRIIETGIPGGYVIAAGNTNAPNAFNPGNLGAAITSAANPGLITVKRGHQVQTGAGLGNGILRCYEILAHNDIGLDATLRLHYLDIELNGFSETGLNLFKSIDQGTSWNVQPNTSVDMATNTLTKTGYASLGGRYTMTSSAAGSLPVTFISFDAVCMEHFIELDWKTATELNSDRFDVQRSPDGMSWEKIGTVKSAGTSNTTSAYHFDDRTWYGMEAFYRLAQHDLDGKMAYSPVAKAGCMQPAAVQLIPNPVISTTALIITTTESNKGMLALFNAAGQQVMHQAIAMHAGSNQYQLNTATLSTGIYSLVITQNGGTLRTLKLIKQ